MRDDDKWWRRRPYLAAFIFAFIAATTGLLIDRYMSRDDVLPARLFHFLALFIILCTIEWVTRRYTKSHD